MNMDDKQKQIEEMAKDLEQAKDWAMGTVGSLNNGFGGWYGAYMYNQGYRKASEVIDEFVERLKQYEESVKIGIEWKAVVRDVDIERIAAEMRQEVEE